MRALPALALALSACTPLTDASAPSVVSARVEEAGPLTRRLHLVLEEPAPVTVLYAAAGDGEGALRVSSPRAAEHRLLLARLRPDRVYRFDVEGSGRSGTFRTAPLPADLAAVPFVAGGEPTTPMVALHLHDPDGFRGFVFVDGAGEVVWFHRTTDLPFGMTRRGNGNFVLLDKGRGLLELTPAGEVVRELPQDAAGREMHHDVIATPWNTLLFLAFDARPLEGGRLLKGEAVWEWTPEAGRVERRWSSWDHLSPERDRGARFGLEWLHANSLAVGPRGNVLVSLHYLDQIVSIAPGWGSLEWRLGGVNATVPVDPAERFSGQHTARELADGGVILFDNRVEEAGPSRVVEFALEGGRATKRWEWTPERRTFAAAVGSARRLPGGNTLVGFGMSAGLLGSTGPVEVYEVTPEGRAVWHLEAPGAWLSYRAEPVRSIAGEEPAAR